MELIDRKNSFLELGLKLKKAGEPTLQKIFTKASNHNPWFTTENIKLSFAGLINYLEEDKLNDWLNRYELNTTSQKTVGVVMAGNLPMVGIHDLICVLLSGHKLKAKLSSQDDVLIPYIVNELVKINPLFKNQIEIVDRLKEFDAVIATGSDNSSRYFEYYFGKYPNVIRKNRTSIAILDGNENHEELSNLGQDIFSYFGLGCRNVSKLFLPTGYDISALISHFENYKYVSDHNKYSNNYYYNKSIFVVNNSEHLDNGFALFQQNENLNSPISVVYYDYYSDVNELLQKLKGIDHKIQCKISNVELVENRVQFGKAQTPEIWDYADNIDTMEFLINL